MAVASTYQLSGLRAHKKVYHVLVVRSAELARLGLIRACPNEHAHHLGVALTYCPAKCRRTIHRRPLQVRARFHQRLDDFDMAVLCSAHERRPATV